MQAAPPKSAPRLAIPTEVLLRILEYACRLPRGFLMLWQQDPIKKALYESRKTHSALILQNPLGCRTFGNLILNNKLLYKSNTVHFHGLNDLSMVLGLLPIEDVQALRSIALLTTIEEPSLRELWKAMPKVQLTNLYRLRNHGDLQTLSLRLDLEDLEEDVAPSVMVADLKNEGFLDDLFKLFSFNIFQMASTKGYCNYPGCRDLEVYEEEAQAFEENARELETFVHAGIRRRRIEASKMPFKDFGLTMLFGEEE